MSEIVPSQSEDPLPLRVGNPDFFPKKDKTLGEYVVTDPRDPFVWLASATEKTVQRAPKPKCKADPMGNVSYER